MRSKYVFYVILSFFMVIFTAMIGYFVWYVQFNAPKAINSSYNMRQNDLERQVIRGTIFSAKGEILAEEAMNSQNVEVRYYPYKELFAHAVGFSTHGKTGVESAANIELLTSNAPLGERLQKEMDGLRNYGDNIYTTFDEDLQKAAYDALGVYKGAVIAMEPKSGKILAMVSKPDYDPNTVSENWAAVSSDTDGSPLVNRAAQGLYPPGSTFKIVTLLEYIREHPDDYDKYSYTCKGKMNYDGVDIECYHRSVHGNEDLRESFEKSCNCSFANIGTLLEKKEFAGTAGDLLFGKTIPTDLAYSKSSFVLNEESGSEEILQTAMGQGKTLITPLHMALITSAIANDGILMRPYEIEKRTNYLGELISETEPKKYKTLMTEKEAEILTDFMVGVVENGTGKRLKGLSYSVAGKTGSAEYGTIKGNSHAWFTGFSNVEDPELVVTVIMEGAGSGGDYAVPVAKRVFDAYYKR